MNPYLTGAHALAARKAHPLSIVGWLRERPLRTDVARQVVGVCVGELENLYMTSTNSRQKHRIREALRQFSNISSRVDGYPGDFLPDIAADVLGEAAEGVTDETGTTSDVSDDAKLVVPDNELELSDFGMDMTAMTDVLDTDGEFEYDDGDDMEYSVIEGFAGMSIGMFDIGAEQIKMNGLKTVSLTIARSLVKHGLDVIGEAIDQANSSNLPGPTARTNCQAHLQWHQNKLAGLSGPPDSTMYDSADDVKKWCMQAYIEANSVQEGAEYISAAWASMWDEIEDGLKKIPAKLAKLPGQAIEAVTGIPWWLVYTGGALALGGIVYGIYKFATSEGGSRIIGGYLGGRR